MASEKSTVEPVKVFAEGLPDRVQEGEVRKMFEAYGEIVEINVVQGRGKNLSFATIKYASPEAAIAAIDDCSDRRIKGYPISVMPFVTDFAARKADKMNMLLLTGLSPTINSAQIRAFFSQFAPVFISKVMYSEVRRQLESRCIGHVQFMDQSGLFIALQAAKQMQSENQVVLESPNLKIRRRVPIRENLYVRGFDETFTEDQLKQVFSQFGRIKSAKIQRSKILEVPLKYGYVCYNQYGAAERAIQALDNKDFQGITWVVRPHEKANDRRTKRSKDYNANIKDRNSRKVLVCNLGDQITEEEVRTMFSEAGEIDDVYILNSEAHQHLQLDFINCPIVKQMQTTEGIADQTFELRQRNIGRRAGQPHKTVFVTYKTIEAADHAVENLNGKEVNGTAIEVTKHARGIGRNYTETPNGRNQDFAMYIYYMQSPFCIPFDRLPAAQQKLILDVNFPNDEEANISTDYDLLAAAFFYHIVSVCEEEFGMFARLVPFILCSEEYKIKTSIQMMLRQELYAFGRDTDKVLSIAREAYTQNIEIAAQFLINFYGGIYIEQVYFQLRNMYAESKYRLMLELSKDEFVKVWDAAANKLEVNRDNMLNFVSFSLQTKSFMELLQSTKNEVDFSSEIPTPKLSE